LEQKNTNFLSTSKQWKHDHQSEYNKSIVVMMMRIIISELTTTKKCPHRSTWEVNWISQWNFSWKWEIFSVSQWKRHGWSQWILIIITFQETTKYYIQPWLYRCLFVLSICYVCGWNSLNIDTICSKLGRLWIL